MNSRERLFALLDGISTEQENGDEGRTEELHLLNERLSGLSYGNVISDIDLFVSRAKAAGSQVFRCSTMADAKSLLVEHIGSERSCVLADDTLLADMDLAVALPAADCSLLSVTGKDLAQDNLQARRKYADADFGITVAHAGLADSGAIVVSSSQKESRSVSLLPIEHVALLPASRILPSLSQAAALFTELQSGEGSSAVTLIGGPSKTADIEKVLVTGIHGPAVFTIIVIDETD